MFQWTVVLPLSASLVQTLNSEGLDQEILSAAAVDEIKNNLELLIAAKQ